MVLGSIASYHLAQEGRVGGQLVAYFVLSLAVSNYNCSDQFNESDGIQT